MTHKPGPELDRLVVEKVMRWRLLSPEIRDVFRDDCGRARATSPGITSGFFPSINIGHAWEVVDRLAPLAGDFKAGDGFFHLIYGQFAEHSRGDDCCPGECQEDEADGMDLAPWSAHIHLGCIGDDGGCPSHWQHGSKFCARGNTAPHAICLAALAATEAAMPPNAPDQLAGASPAQLHPIVGQQS